MKTALEPAEVEHLYRTGAQLLFPSSHAARLWRRRLAALTSEEELLPALAWREWTSSMWARVLLEGDDDRILLNRVQEEQLWAEIVAASPETKLLSPSALRDLAVLARTGLQRAADYRVIHRLHTEADSPESRVFARWIQLFEERCRRDRLLSSSSVEDELSHACETGTVKAPSSVCCVGWQRTSPAQARLLDAVRASGSSVRNERLVIGREQAARTELLAGLLPNHLEELRAAVQRIQVHAKEVSKVEPASVAILSPDPAMHQHALERLFREVLAPELEGVSQDLSSTPWFVSTGTPLSLTSAAGDALHLLRWCIEALPLHRIEHLLLSPYLAFSDSYESRARLDLAGGKLRASLRGSLSLGDFTRLLPKLRGTGSGPHLPELQRFWGAVQRASLSRARLSHAAWGDTIRRLLAEIGWPGTRTPTPAEFEAFQTWEGVLDTLATLQFDGRRISFREFLDALSREAATARVENLVPEAAIQVLTPDQAQGLPFQLVVHLDATERKLPFPEALHPLLPTGLQRSLGIAEPNATLAQARAALQDLASRTATLVLLGSPDAACEQDEALSPLAGWLPFRELPAAELVPMDAATSPVAMEAIPTPAPSAFHGIQAPGGSDLLRRQAACGFSAFATYRLGARTRTARSLGLDAMENGTILHDALAHFWSVVQSSGKLRSMSNQERQTQVDASVAIALNAFGSSGTAAHPWDLRYLAVLHQRFSKLLLCWCEMELKRAPFTVLSQETKQYLTLGNLQFSLRTDRVDDVGAGLVLVDYKTSANLACAQWQGERPDAPQLPAYSLLPYQTSVLGVAFGQVKLGKDMGWVSLADRPTLFPGKPSKKSQVADMLEQRLQWRTDLTRLADAFAQGECTVDPKTFPDTCRYCGLRALCRLDPAKVPQHIEDEAIEEQEIVRG